MRQIVSLLVVLGLGCLLAAGCASPAEYTSMITGTVSYHQRIALPSNAVVEVKLVDLSLGETNATVVASRMIHGQTVLPMSYSLKYPRLAWLEGRQYAVQARVLVDGRPWMVPEAVNHVMANGRIARADVILRFAR